MSPLWRDEVAIYLAPRKVALARRSRGLRSRVVAETEIALLAGASRDIGPVLARLGEVLAKESWHRARARVVIADHPWARYGVIPWPGARLDAAGRLAHARCVLGDLYGDAVADWEVTLADAPPGRSCVACATPPALRQAVEEALAPARLSLVSLQPQLIVAFNAWRHRLQDDAWFVSVDDGSLSAVHVREGAWDQVHMARLSTSWGVELERLKAFGRITRAAGVTVPMFVDAPAWMRRGAGPTDGIEWLEGDDAGAQESALLRRMYA